jgi:SAM-dependent methyltransferase
MEVLEWIDRELLPSSCATPELIYDYMESQSGGSLPVIYMPFDPANRSHWQDRGAILDFLLATRAERGRVLDLGPGDGWPSLMVAPFAAEVIGVEASMRRVEVCEANAERLGISNAHFHYVPPGMRLPFRDGSFDGVMAASSIEQTPDSRGTVREIHRLLRPGGRFRVFYEALGQYRGGREKDLWISGIGDNHTRLILYDRHPDGEYADQYGITLDLPPAALRERLAGSDGEPDLRLLTPDLMESLKERIAGACVCRTGHPSGPTLAAMLEEAGFSEIIPSEEGRKRAGDFYDSTPEEARPGSIDEVDRMLRPVVTEAISTTVPLDTDPMLTAIK